MKSRVLFFVLILVLLTAALTACVLFDGSVGKAELDADMIVCPDLYNSYVYTGREVTLDLQVRSDGEILDLDLFNVEYKDNVEAGTASVIVTAKEDNPYVKGSVTLHFTILSNESVRCEASDDLAALLASASVSGVQIWSDYTIPEGVTITVPEGKSLNMIYGYRFFNYGTIVNNGTVVIRGALLSTGARRATELMNYGSIENHGAIEIQEYAIVNDLGSFTSERDIQSAGTVYLKDEGKIFLVNETDGNVYVRTPVTADVFTVEECTYTQGYNEYEPRVSPKAYGTDFTVEYANNRHAGTATATVTVGAYDSDYYGTVDIPFEIKKGQANASDAEQLKELVASGDYERYTIATLEIPSGEVFTLPAGQCVTVTVELAVGGTMNAQGDVACNNLTIAEGATLVNEGTLSVSGYKFIVNGTFRNAATGNWTFATKAVNVSGSFVNFGTVENKTFNLLQGGTLRNEGTLSLSFNSVQSGVFENVGKATFLGASNYAPAFRNEQGGEVTLTGDVRFGTGFENAGAVVNTGRVALQEHCAYANSGTIDNSRGEVWAYQDLAGVTEHFHKKKKLSDDGVVFSAEYAEIPYNTLDQKPDFTVDGAPLPEGEYNCLFYSVTLGKYVTECVKKGDYKMYVSINTDYSDYAGYVEYVYSILPTTIRVADSSDYYTAARDDGYDRIVLDGDVELYSNSGIGEGCVLDLNGHKLVVRNYFSFYGTMTGGAAVDPESFVPDEDAACLVVENSGYFYNYGRIVNDGFVFVKSGGSFSANARSSRTDPLGTVVNNGVIFTPSDVTVESGAGKVYRRKNMTEIKSLVRVPTVPYDGTPQTPAPTMTYNGSDVDVARFSLRYDLNVEAGTALLRLDVVDPLDPDFYGTTSVSFTIERGTASVGNESELTAAGADPNYAVIRLISEVRVATTIPLSDDQLLDIGAYEVTGSGKVVFGKNCKLILTAGNQTRFVKYLYGADEITLTGDIGVAGTQTELTFSSYTIGNYQNANYLSTVVHLEGYSFLGGLHIQNDNIENFKLTLENSAEERSRIGTEIGGVALTYSSCKEETFVTITNTTVYGAKMGGGYGTAQHVSLTATNCSFLASTETAKACAFNLSSGMSAEGSFENCTFEASNAFRANQGDFDFTSCTFRSYDAYSDKYSSHYGDALFFEYSGRHGLHVTVTECTLVSQNGNGVHLLNRNNAVTLTVDNATTYEGPLSKSVG